MTRPLLWLMKQSKCLCVGIILLPSVSFCQVQWSIIFPSTVNDLRRIERVHFANPSQGWVAGFDAGTGRRFLLRTMDGGETWEEEETKTPYPSVFFLTPSEGWVIQTPGSSSLLEDIQLRHTLDGGWSWNTLSGKIVKYVEKTGIAPLRPFSSKYVGSLFFLDSQRGWLVGSTEAQAYEDENLPKRGFPWRICGNLVFTTNDGGNTWNGNLFDTYVYEEVEKGATSPRGPISIQFTTPTNGWIAVSAVPNGNLAHWLFRTTDGANEWRKIALPEGNGLTNLHFLNSSMGFAVTSGMPDNRPRVIASSDGGGSWQESATFPGEGRSPSSYYPYDSIAMWVAFQTLLKDGWKLSIYSTGNGGKVWTLEWEADVSGIGIGPSLSYVEYDVATKSVWAGGLTGILLRRSAGNLPTAISSRGKLAVSWGKLKADAH